MYKSSKLTAVVGLTVVCNLISCAGVELVAPTVELTTTADGCRRAVVVQSIPTGSPAWSATSTVEIVERCRRDAE